HVAVHRRPRGPGGGIPVSVRRQAQPRGVAVARLSDPPRLSSHRSLRPDAAASGARLDAWLARALPELSRARLQALLADGAVRVHGRTAKPSRRLRGGEEITVEVPEPVAAVPAPEPLPLSIVHEDPHLLVIDKPAGLAVHPGAGRSSGTLVNALLHHV